MGNDTRLKPCPFCGGEAKYFAKTFTERGVTRGWEFGIYCTKCDICTPKTNYKIEITFEGDGEIKATVDEREIAAEMCNRRVSDER